MDSVERALRLEAVASEVFGEGEDATLAADLLGPVLAKLATFGLGEHGVPAFLEQQPHLVRNVTFDELVDTFNEYVDWQGAQEALHLRAALRTSPNGVVISDPSSRGITIGQLRRVHVASARLCGLERWAPAAPERQMIGGLSGESITTNDILHHLVAPLTRNERSLVEVMATAEQRPKWFVISSWDQPLKNVIRCLEQHARDHGLEEEESPYWLAAFAVEPSADAASRPTAHALSMPGARVRSSLFCRALATCQGALLVLDEKASALSRIHCMLEAYATTSQFGPDFRLDVYTCIPGLGLAAESVRVAEDTATSMAGVDARMALFGQPRARDDLLGNCFPVGLVDGIAFADLAGGVLSAHDNKSARESSFPLELAAVTTQADFARNVVAARGADLAKIRELFGEDVHTLDGKLRCRLGLTMLPKLMAERTADAGPTILAFVSVMRAAGLGCFSLACSSSVPAERSALLAGVLHPRLESVSIVHLSCVHLMPHLCALLRGNTALTAIDLTDASLGDEQICKLTDALRQNCTLCKLTLASNAFHDVGIAALGRALCTMPTLVTLCLDSNRISAQGAFDLSDALRGNGQLRSLSLYDNALGDAGASFLAEALSVNGSLEFLGLASNSIGDLGAFSLAEMLAVNATVNTLELDDNLIGDPGALALARALAFNSSLTTLELGDNANMSEQISTAFAEGMALRNRALSNSMQLSAMSVPRRS